MHKPKLQTQKGKPSNAKAMVKSSKSEIRVPAAISTHFKPKTATITTRKDGSMLMSGSDLLIEFNSGSDAIGTILGKIPMNPQTDPFLGTRLGIESIRFEKYRFTKLNFLYEPDVPTDQSGSIILLYDPDASDDLNFTTTPSLTFLQTVMAFKDSEKLSLWSPGNLKCSPKCDPQKFFYTNFSGDDARLAQQGNFYVFLSGKTGVTNLSIGTIALEWEIEFFQPTLENLNPATRAHATSGATVSGTGRGFNTLGPPNVVSTQNGPRLEQDGNGNKYFDMLPGVYDIISMSEFAINGLNSIGLFFLGNLPLQQVTLDLIHSNGMFAGTQNVNSNEWKLTVPQGGGKLYGTFPASATITDWVFSILKNITNNVLTN